MHYIISVVRDQELHQECLHAGQKTFDDAFSLLPLPGQHALSEAWLFNACLDALPDDADGWLIFCPETTVFQNLSADLLKDLDPESIYGVFGARLAQNLQKKPFCEYCGQIRDWPQEGKTPHDLLAIKLHGAAVQDGTPVEVLGRQCLLLHSSLCRRHALRFDQNYSEDFHVEDFCLRVRAGHGIKSRIISLPLVFPSLAPAPDADRLIRLGRDFARYHARHTEDNSGESLAGTTNVVTQARNMPDACPADQAKAGVVWPGKSRVCVARFADLPAIIKAAGLPGSAVFTPLLREETALTAPADVYHHRIDKRMVNVPAAIALRMMQPKSRILDVGCSFGDNGLLFKNELGANLWGLEYSAESLDYARKRDIYAELVQVDLENMRLPDFSRYYQFFNHIFIGDVLEHLRNPGATLSMCREFLASGGSIIVSLPNVTHAYVQAALLSGRFKYQASGVLDYTHLRFFGGVDQAALYARQGLEIKQAAASFACPGENKIYHLPMNLPGHLYEHLLGNRHFLALQYICQLEKSDLDFAELKVRNLDKIEQSVGNNPAGLELEGIKYRQLLKDLEEKLGIQVKSCL